MAFNFAAVLVLLLTFDCMAEAAVGKVIDPIYWKTMNPL